MKRIATIQDLSGVGKCSLSIALPVISAMGIECAVLPTAVLSAHTAVEGFVSKGLTDLLAPFAAHWQQLGLQFDALYSGYLASPAQVAQVNEIFDTFSTENNLIFVDPVMADHGKLYAGFEEGFPQEMGKLCARADVITPNVTEACLLTGTPYRETHDETFIRMLLHKLLELGAHTAIITGVRYDPKSMGVAAMDASGSLSVHFTDYVPAVFHGIGDLFASTCVGALTLGYSPADAISLAADYVVRTICVTAANPDAPWYGVDFETTIPYLLSRLKNGSSREEAI